MSTVNAASPTATSSSATSAAVRAGRGRRALLVSLVLLSLVALTLVAKPAVAAVTCTLNAVACENQLAGTPESVWDIDGAGDDSIQGFATSISVNAGSAVQFKIDTNARAYTIKIYRLGYYQGNGAREVATIVPSATLPQVQPACAQSLATEIYDCGTWGVSAAWSVPATAVSGVYIARLIRTDTGGDSHIPFIVRNDGNTSNVLYQTSDTTWQAYNGYGGSTYYHGKGNGRAYKLSYNRPFETRGTANGRDFLFSNEYPMIRFLEQNGYDVSYVSGLDTHLDANLLGKHKAFLSVGHDEYWSTAQRAHVTAARDAGVNLAFFSGNEVYWKTRWEPSEDGTNTANRTLVCYKDTWAGEQIDPVEPTPTWRDPSFGDLGFGSENSLTGTQYQANSDDLPVTVSAAEGKLRLWRNTTLTTMSGSQTAALADHTIGYESNEDVDNGNRPAGLIRMSTTTGPTPEYLTDFGNTVVAGTTTHHLTQYRAASGALVFSAGSVQWAWGLDDHHDGVTAPPDPRMRQATVNVLADMGAPATTVATGLTASSKSTDTTPPTSTVTSPVSGSSAQPGSLITVTGTASDTGGRVGGVEVSVDGGATFHAATGRESFSYTDILTGSGPNAIQARATDDSGRIQTTTTKVAVDAPCPCSLFGVMTPTTIDSGDGGDLTLGTKFTTSTAGFITGVRFYKAAANGGTHKGTLYSSTGTVLATGTFSGETPSGWQTLTFAEAVPVSAGSTYVAAYYAPGGHYSADKSFFATRSYTADTLTAPGGPSNPNGVFTDGNGFPANSFKQTNYYVDAVFGQTDTTPLNVLSVSPLTDATSALTTAVITARFSRDVTTSSIGMQVLDADNTVVPGLITYDAASRSAKFTPNQPLATGIKYTVTVVATASGAGMAAPYQWSFTTVKTPSPAGTCPCTIFDESTQPSGAPATETSRVQLGTAFQSKTAGVISGVRFFKAAENTGVHVVKLSRSDGTELASATVTNESTSGWQQADFDSPIVIAAATTYIASYTALGGRYSYQAGGLSSKITRTPLSTLASGGRYAYGTAAPTNASDSSYFVDAVFNSAPGKAPAVATVAPGDQATSVPVTASVTATFDSDIQPGSASITVSETLTSVPVAGTTPSETQGSGVTFVPSSPLKAGTGYTVKVSGARSASGTTMAAGFVSTFTTAGADVCPCSLMDTSTVPTLSDSNDGTPTTLGVKFTASVNGFVKGLRYYRDAANTGTHVGRIYSSGGTVLASVTFTEQAAGWQTAMFSSAVAVTAGTTYVASYYAPTGRYSASTGYFDQPLVNAPLSSVGSGGVYSDGNTFPSSTYLNANYYVDVVFTTNDSDPPEVTDQSPAAGSVTDVDTTVQATFARAITPTSLSLTVSGPLGPVSGQLSYSSTTRTATFVPAVVLDHATDYTVTVSATSASGVSMTAPKTWTFSTSGAPPVGQPYTLFGNATPEYPAWNDAGPVTVGVRFSPSSDGKVTAIRFYAGPGNTGTQVVTLYNSSGTVLATKNTTGTETGWRTVTFTTPVSITAGDTYVAAYYAPTGHYAVSAGVFNTPFTSGPLTVPAGGATYRYPSGFPTESSSANYWVDVIAVM